MKTLLSLCGGIAIASVAFQALAQPTVTMPDTPPNNASTLSVTHERPGASQDSPLLPVSMETLSDTGRTSFQINIPNALESVFIWVDPAVAVGYDYLIEEGPKVAKVKLPKGFGDNLYDLWLPNGEKEAFVDTGVDITAGETYTFPQPVGSFSIRGIEAETKLDPKNGAAFPTGLAFAEDAALVKMRMTSVVTDTEQEPQKK